MLRDRALVEGLSRKRSGRLPAASMTNFNKQLAPAQRYRSCPPALRFAALSGRAQLHASRGVWVKTEDTNAGLAKAYVPRMMCHEKTPSPNALGGASACGGHGCKVGKAVAHASARTAAEDRGCSKARGGASTRKDTTASLAKPCIRLHVLRHASVALGDPSTRATLLSPSHSMLRAGGRKPLAGLPHDLAPSRSHMSKTRRLVRASWRRCAGDEPAAYGTERLATVDTEN